MQLGVFQWTTYGHYTDTSAVLRLECSLDCISGSVGHQQHIFRLFYHRQRFL